MALMESTEMIRPRGPSGPVEGTTPDTPRQERRTPFSNLGCTMACLAMAGLSAKGGGEVATESLRDETLYSLTSPTHEPPTAENACLAKKVGSGGGED